MDTIKRQVEDSCAFLERFVSAERGFTTGDARAGIGRLRRLIVQSDSDADRRLAKQWVRCACEKLGLRDENYRWACEERQ